MNNEDKILELLGSMQTSMQAMQADMKGMHEKIDKLTEGQEELREDLDEVRTSVNALLDWSDRVSSIEQLRIPKIG